MKLEDIIKSNTITVSDSSLYCRNSYDDEDMETHVNDLISLVGENVPSLKSTSHYVTPKDFDIISNAIRNHRFGKKMNILDVSNYENKLYIHMPSGSKVKIVSSGGNTCIIIFLKYIQWYTNLNGSIQAEKFSFI